MAGAHSRVSRLAGGGGRAGACGQRLLRAAGIRMAGCGGRRMRVAPPPHVPADLVVDLDFYNIAGPEGDVFQAWKDFGEQCRGIRGGNAPIVWTSRNGGHWIAATGEAVEA